MEYQSVRADIALKEFGVSAECGLSDKQAAERLGIYGKNMLSEKKRPNIVLRFFAQLNDFMVLILLFAAAVSVVVSTLQGERDFIDPLIILAIVCMNAVMGLAQESKAERALEALKKMSAPQAKALRNSAIVQLSTELLVRGDIILLEAGDFVPADARLVSSYNLKADESALTGESLPVEKDAGRVLAEGASIGDRVNMVFSGTNISCGRGVAVVTKTGMNTEVGKIAELINSNDTPETPLQKRLERTGKILGIGALIICALVFVCGLMRSIPAFDMFMTSVSLAVAAIPEGLPAIVTIMLALGVSRMAKQNAIIRRLPAVETLGQATVICSDKTGTLTQNRMKVTEVSDGFSRLPARDERRLEILRLAALCSDCASGVDGELHGDPTETAIVRAAEAGGLSKRRLDGEYERTGEIPFDSARKLMTIVVKSWGKTTIITKGAPDVLLKRCTHYLSGGKRLAMNEAERATILKTNAGFAIEALRVLAVAFHDGGQEVALSSENTEKGLTFAGLIGMIDPPREEAFEAVMLCRKAGIRPVMITGDHILTANAIARKLGILRQADRSMTGEELDRMPQEELCREIGDYTVFARVTPEHKLRIVQAFQSRGEIVAMTGDGVNDAPALKAADIGCAMGKSGTDVAKGAADMILTDDNFATIVYTVKEGRVIYSNIRKSVHFLLSSNIGEIITIFAAILLGWKTPLIAIHLLWVNLVTDSLPAIALGLDPAEPGIMGRKPFAREKSLFSEGLWQKIVFEGMMIGMLALIAFGVGTILFDSSGSHIAGRTMAFATLSLTQLVHAFNMRSEGSLFSTDLFGNPYLIGAFLAGIALQVSVIMLPPLASVFKVVPLNAREWLVVTVLSIMPLIIVELEKLVLARFSTGAWVARQM